MRISQKKTIYESEIVAKLLCGILNDVGEHLIPTCVQSRLEDISRWGIDNIGCHLVPGPDDPNGSAGNAYDAISSDVLEGWNRVAE